MDAEKKLAALVSPYLSIRKIEVQGFTINYVKIGVGPDLLLIHGANMGWGQWYPNIAELAKNFTVYALDLPGAGASSAIDFRGADFQKDFVNVVRVFIESLKLNNLSIIGHSFGGWIALQLALKNTIKINKIVLVDSLGFTGYRPLRHGLIAIYPFAEFLSKTAVKPNRKNMEKFLSGVMHNKTVINPAFIDYFYESVYKEKTKHPFFMINRLTGLLGLDKELNLKRQLSKININILILTGDRDPLIPLKKSAKNFKLIAKTKIHVFAETGHVPSLERSREFNSIVIEFLK